MCTKFLLKKRLQPKTGLIPVIAFVMLIASGSISIKAQRILPTDSVPPPMKFVPREDRKQISTITDLKSRHKLTVDLAEERLSKAENFTKTGQFDQALIELGYYHGLVEEALQSLHQPKRSGKILDLLKKFDITLRAHGVRLQAIKRITPSDYTEHIDGIYDYTLEVRNKALNTFFGDTVLTEKPNEKPLIKETVDKKSAETEEKKE
jgi:hypothetical protein